MLEKRKGGKTGNLEDFMLHSLNKYKNFHVKLFNIVACRYFKNQQQLL